MAIEKKVLNYGANGAMVNVYTDEQGVCFLVLHAMPNGDTNGVFHALGERNFGPAERRETLRVTHGRLVVQNMIYEPGEIAVVEEGEQIIIEPLEIGTSYICRYGPKIGTREWQGTRKSMAQDILNELRQTHGLTDQQVMELIGLILQQAARSWDREERRGELAEKPMESGSTGGT